MMFAGAVKLITTVITFNAFFGAVVVLIFFWRRLSMHAVWVSFILWIILIGIMPGLVPKFDSLRRSPALIQETPERTIEAIAGATQEDVAAGLAGKVGQTINKSYTIRPVAIYFESVARSNPNDLNSPREGVGTFRIETYLLHLIGIPVQQFNKAGILAARWGVDGVLPFVMLMALSYIFPGRKVTDEDKHRIDGFFAKMKTPVGATPELDDRDVALSYEQPHRFDHKKLFPGTNWEFSKWTKHDFLGFFGCWGVVLLILGFLWLLVNIGR